MVRILKLFVFGLLALIAAFLGWVYLATYHPADEMPLDIVETAEAPLAPSDRPLKILSWNIQFLAGNYDNHFFYSGGEDVWPPVERTETVADELAAVLRSENPDVILIQEIDLDADRTGRRNQVEMLLKRLNGQYPVQTSTYYWKADFVPHPAIMGRAGMALTILSKYKLTNAVRYALPMITSDDILTRQFNLKRAIQTADLQLEGGQTLTLLNTHLSAFAQGTDTMERQIARVMQVTSDLDNASKPWVMGGDFNLLMDPSLIEYVEAIDQWEYNEAFTALTPLADKYASFPSKDQTQSDTRSAYLTHVSAKNPTRQPDKTIDYIFTANTVSLTSGTVRRKDTLLIADHLPVIVGVQVKAAP